MTDKTPTEVIEQMMAEMQEKYLRELRELAENYKQPPPAEEQQGDGAVTLPYQPQTHVAATITLPYQPQSDEVPTITLPYQPTNTWEYSIGKNALTILCACGEELQVDETMQDEDGGLAIKVRPHDCREYNHAAVRRVCDKLAVMLNEHFDAAGD